jgi:hypothetical protein
LYYIRQKSENDTIAREKQRLLLADSKRDDTPSKTPAPLNIDQAAQKVHSTLLTYSYFEQKLLLLDKQWQKKIIEGKFSEEQKQQEVNSHVTSIMQ